MRPVNHSPTRAARRAVIHRVESEYERFDCISDMHKFGVKMQQFLWTETSAEITALYSYSRCGPWAAFFSALFMCFKQAPMPGRYLPNKNRHQRWCWRLLWEWKWDGARTPIMLTLWYRTARTKHTARASQIFCGESSFRLTRFSADSRSSLTKNLAQPPPLLATCTFAIRTSRSLRYLATPKLVLTHTHYGKAGFTQSEFELQALSEVPGTPKMVLSHIKYGKAGCDREITPRLGVCDRDITTLSAHALIGHCLGNSHVTCQKYGIIREYEDETGESQPNARSAEGCDSPCRIRVRALWLHFWHAQIRGQSATIFVNRNFSWNHGLVQLGSRCGPWAAFFCFVHVFQTSPNARASFAKQNSASAMMLTSRLRVEVWRCSNANHADTLVPHGNWRERSTRPEHRRFFAVSLLSCWHDLWSWFTHVFQQIPDPV